MGTIVLGEISHYLLTKFSALLDEAEKDLTKLSCISRFRNAETLIKSNYLNPDNTTSSKITPVNSDSSTDIDIRNLLYHLISALSDCRVFAQQHRGSVAPKNAFLQFKHLWFVRRTNRRLDGLDRELKDVLSRRQFLIVAGLAPASNVVDEDDEDGVEGLSDKFIGLDSAAEKVKEFLVNGSVNDSSSSLLKGIAIVGAAGSGKTALARKVFDSWPVRNMFAPRIWVSLSGTLYDEPVSTNLRVKILRKMLEQAGCDVSELVTSYVGIPELTEKLYHRLMGKRYLIVLDEVWHAKYWHVDLDSELPKGDEFGDCISPEFGDCISDALPKDSGGRIIITSRRGGVAREVVGGKNLIFIDTLLSQEICWSVFSDAVRKDGKIELKDISLSKMEEEIGKKCVGLPLAARILAEIIPEQICQKQ